MRKQQQDCNPDETGVAPPHPSQQRHRGRKTSTKHRRIEASFGHSKNARPRRRPTTATPSSSSHPSSPTQPSATQRKKTPTKHRTIEASFGHSKSHGLAGATINAAPIGSTITTPARHHHDRGRRRAQETAKDSDNHQRHPTTATLTHPQKHPSGSSTRNPARHRGPHGVVLRRTSKVLNSRRLSL